MYRQYQAGVITDDMPSLPEKPFSLDAFTAEEAGMAAGGDVLVPDSASFCGQVMTKATPRVPIRHD